MSQVFCKFCFSIFSCLPVTLYYTSMSYKGCKLYSTQPQYINPCYVVLHIDELQGVYTVQCTLYNTQPQYINPCYVVLHIDELQGVDTVQHTAPVYQSLLR